VREEGKRRRSFGGTVRIEGISVLHSGSLEEHRREGEGERKKESSLVVSPEGPMRKGEKQNKGGGGKRKKREGPPSSVYSRKGGGLLHIRTRYRRKRKRGGILA